MLLMLIIKNLFFLLKSCISILNLIKKKNVYFLIVFISINLFIMPNMAYCETTDIEKSEYEISIDEEQPKRSKLINNICLLIFGIAFLILWWEFLGYLLDEDGDSDFYDADSSSDELPEVKPPHEPYKQGPGYNFFVRDMGIRYDDNLYYSPDVDVTKTNLYDPKDGPIPNVDVKVQFPNLENRQFPKIDFGIKFKYVPVPGMPPMDQEPPMELPVDGPVYGPLPEIYDEVTIIDID